MPYCNLSDLEKLGQRSTRFTVLKMYTRYLQDSPNVPFYSMDVMFDSDSIVVTSLAVTFLTLKSGSKVTALQTHPRYWQNAANVCFGIDVIFGSGNFAVTSKVMVKVTMPRSKVGEPK